jgi:hypothetical protein
MSTRETILAAIATALSGVASGRVYRSRREQIGTLPSVVIEPQSDNGGEAVLGVQDRSLNVDVSVYASGDTPDAAADAVIGAIWSALVAAPTLGLGSNVQLDMQPTVEWDYEDFDHVRAIVRVTYLYRTALGSL